MTVKFDFMEAYRKPQPSISSEILDARKKSHDKLYEAFKDMKQVYQLCLLAFDLPQDTQSLLDWFQPPIKEFDPRFSLSTDKAEAARIAALLLRDLISRGSSPQGALAVLICSFGGRRSPVDRDLLSEAHDYLTEKSNAKRIIAADMKIAAPAAQDIKNTLDAMNPASPATLRAAVDALAGDARNAVTKTALSANTAHQSLRTDVYRLAEEVDMLWWHVGDWSEKLNCLRTELSNKIVGPVSGIELGQFVRDLPGPLGAFGILRRTLGSQSEKKTKLKDFIEALGAGVGKLASKVPYQAKAAFPVHTALQLASESEKGTWEAKFESQVGQLKSFELSNFDLSVQAFRERILIKSAGLPE